MTYKRIDIDLAMAYHMGYEDALARRKPMPSKTEMLESAGIADEREALRELCADLAAHLLEAERIHGDYLMPDGYMARLRECGVIKEWE